MASHDVSSELSRVKYLDSTAPSPTPDNPSAAAEIAPAYSRNSSYHDVSEPSHGGKTQATSAQAPYGDGPLKPLEPLEPLELSLERIGLLRFHCCALLVLGAAHLCSALQMQVVPLVHPVSRPVLNLLNTDPSRSIWGMRPITSGLI